MYIYYEKKEEEKNRREIKILFKKKGGIENSTKTRGSKICLYVKDQA